MKMVETNRPKPPAPPPPEGVATDRPDAECQHRHRQQQSQQQRCLQQLLPPQRHTKTVHFETDVFRDGGDDDGCCDDDDSGGGGGGGGSVSSLPDQFDRHVQQLFAFIGSALSAGRCSDEDDDDEDDEHAGCCEGGDDDDDCSDSHSDYVGDDHFYGGGFCGDEDDRRSVSDDETVRRRWSSSYMQQQQHRRPLSRGARAVSFERDVDRGNPPPFRHIHCKTSAGTCNRVFLKKVTTTAVTSRSPLDDNRRWAPERVGGRAPAALAALYVRDNVTNKNNNNNNCSNFNNYNDTAKKIISQESDSAGGSNRHDIVPSAALSFLSNSPGRRTCTRSSSVPIKLPSRDF